MNYSWFLTSVVVFLPDSPRGGSRAGQKYIVEGPLLHRTSERKVIATHEIDSNDPEACGKKCCYFWFYSEVKFLTSLHAQTLSFLAYFYAISVDFYSRKC